MGCFGETDDLSYRLFAEVKVVANAFEGVDVKFIFKQEEISGIAIGLTASRDVVHRTAQYRAH